MGDRGAFTITSISSTLASLFGSSSEGEPVDTICARESRSEFINWMQHNMNTAFSYGEVPSSFGRMKFQVQPLHGEAILYESNVSGIFDFVEEVGTVTLRLYPPRRPSSRGSRSSSRSRGSSQTSMKSGRSRASSGGQSAGKAS